MQRRGGSIQNDNAEDKAVMANNFVAGQNSSNNIYIQILGMEEIEKALGDIKSKTPAVMKVTLNATARQARKVMIAKAKARYAVNSHGLKYLQVLKQKGTATNNKLATELYIKTPKNDLGYFQYSPKSIYTGQAVFTDAPSTVQAKVLKASQMKPLTGTAGFSKGFVLEFSSGHVGMVQRVIGSSSSNTTTARGYERWTNSEGNVEKLQTMGSPSATKMHEKIWPEAEPEVLAYAQERLDQQIQKVLQRAGR